MNANTPTPVNVLTSKTYNLANVPTYRKPLVQLLIENGEIFSDEFDTPDNLDRFAEEILDLIIEHHLLDEHLRRNLQPEHHD